MSKKYRRFTYFFMTTTLSFVLGSGLFNLGVDPYGVFKTKNISGLNYYKPKQKTQDRLLKAIEITQLKPQIVILGSSRVQWSMNPTHPALNQQKNPYNSGLDGVTFYELSRYLQHISSNQEDLETVILGIDFEMFLTYKTNPANTFKEKRLDKKKIIFDDYLSLLFSRDALSDSYQTIVQNINQSNDNYYLQGLYVVNEESKPGSLESFIKFIKKDWRDRKKIEHNELNKISKKYLNDLKTMFENNRNKDISTYIFIPCMHALHLEKLYVQGSWDSWENWKRELVKIAPVWDFSGYNSITTEPIQNQMENYIDSSHYRKEVGDLILNRILDYKTETVPEDFGVLITPENIEQHLKTIRRDRQLWTQNNPDAVKLLQDIKREVEKKETN